MHRIHTLRTICLLATTFVCAAGTVSEPPGRLLLKSVFLTDFLQPVSSNYVNATVTCSTLSSAGRVYFEYPTKKTFPGIAFMDGYDLSVVLLSHESVECELTEEMEDDEMVNSHGSCEFTYARFLAPSGNEVTCTLSDGSAFVLKMDCGGQCPDPIPPPDKQYCQKSKKLLPVDIGRSHSFTDGSPGFAMYAPKSRCSWTLPRARKGAINFVFSRLDLGTGDHIKFYASPDGKKRKLIRTYDHNSTPQSASTAAKFMILEFVSDSADEGLGFAGFYYFTEEVMQPVTIVPRTTKSAVQALPTPSPSNGRKLLEAFR